MRQLMILVFCALVGSMQAQDKHFTQFYASPLTLNPALAGSTGGKYRAGVVYRSQWKGVLESPFRTFAGSVDLRFRVFKNNPNKDYVGVGISFYSDRVASIDFSNTQMALTAAYHKSLDPRDRQYLSMGVQVGFSQRNVNIAKLTFQDMFNGVDGYTGATAEELPENNFGYTDLNLGLNYSGAIGRRSHFYAGAAMHHALAPNISFYRRGDNVVVHRLFRKYSGQLSADLSLGGDMALLPRFLIAVQGPHMEINTGANVRFKLGKFSPYYLHLGSWVRPVRDETNSVFLDAAVLLLGLQIDNFVFGLSYDASISDLTTYRRGQNAFELSLVFIGDYVNDEVMCPKF